MCEGIHIMRGLNASRLTPRKVTHYDNTPITPNQRTEQGTKDNLKISKLSSSNIPPNLNFREH